MHADLKVKSPSTAGIEPGDVRRFGPDGVLYEIKRKHPGGRLLIRVLDTGEETLYPLAKALQDPRG
jgi:hypothetical protein